MTILPPTFLVRYSAGWFIICHLINLNIHEIQYNILTYFKLITSSIKKRYLIHKSKPNHKIYINTWTDYRRINCSLFPSRAGVSTVLDVFIINWLIWLDDYCLQYWIFILNKCSSAYQAELVLCSKVDWHIYKFMNFSIERRDYFIFIKL